MSNQAAQHHEEVLSLEKQFESNLSDVTTRIEKLEGDAKAHSQICSDNQKKITTVEKVVEKVKASHSDLSNQLTAHRDEVEAAKRLFKFDKKVNNDELNDKIAKMDIDLNIRIESLETDFKKLNSKTDSTESKITASCKHSENRLSDIEHQLTNLKKTIAGTGPGASDSAPTAVMSSEIKASKTAPTPVMSLGVQDTIPTTEMNPIARDENGSIEPENILQDIHQSSIRNEMDSRFQAYCTKVQSQLEVDSFLAKICSITPEKATHNMIAYKFKDIIDAEDDGEVGGSERVLDLIIHNKLDNIAIVVCRWYGGTHMGSRRYDLIKECATEALVKAKLISHIPSITDMERSPSQSHPPVKTLYLSDSTGALVNVRILCGDNGVKDVAPTLDAVCRKLKQSAPDIKRIVIQSGVNDIDNSSIEQVKKKIIQVVETTKEYHPRAELFVTSILPDNGEKNSRYDINHFIKSQSIKSQFKFIDLCSKFEERRNLLRDRKHPNKHGTAVLAAEIRLALGFPKIDKTSQSFSKSQNIPRFNNPPSQDTSRRNQESQSIATRQTTRPTNRFGKNNQHGSSQALGVVPISQTQPWVGNSADQRQIQPTWNNQGNIPFNQIQAPLSYNQQKQSGYSNTNTGATNLGEPNTNLYTQNWSAPNAQSNQQNTHNWSAPNAQSNQLEYNGNTNTQNQYIQGNNSSKPAQPAWPQQSIYPNEYSWCEPTNRVSVGYNPAQVSHWYPNTQAVAPNVYC
jgi:hypothetical protein